MAASTWGTGALMKRKVVMSNRTKRSFFNAAILAGALALSQAATAGRVIVNNDEWTFTDYGFSQAVPSTLTFAKNLASFMNVDGGACKLLVYSSNFGLTGSSLGGALAGANCMVAYSTGTFDLATLSGFDGVLLAGLQYGYDAGILAAYIDSGHSAYIAGGTGVVDEDTMWDSFAHLYGLDFGTRYNGIVGTLGVAGADPLLAGVSELYFKNGNSVSLHGPAPNSRIIADYNGAGLIGVYDGPNQRVTLRAVPEPATIALLGAALAGLGVSRRRSMQQRDLSTPCPPTSTGPTGPERHPRLPSSFR
jgi:hypothetical protein